MTLIVFIQTFTRIPLSILLIIDPKGQLNSRYYTLPLLLVWSNSGLNFVVYALTNTPLKRGMKAFKEDMISRFRNKSGSTSQNTESHVMYRRRVGNCIFKITSNISK